MQRIIGSILYYAKAVDMTKLMALSTVARKQTKATEQTLEKCTQLLDYLTSNSDAKVRYYTSDMVMNIHSDASNLLEAKVRRQTYGHFFTGWVPQNGEPINLNGVFHVDSSILQFVVASTVRAKLGALFHNPQTGIIFQSILDNLGHPQPKTPVHWDNTTAVGITNSLVRRQHSQSMENEIFVD
jgi:hypothetical protein